MNDRLPEPGSAWARHCPDAWPRDWLDETRTLPPGFTRAAAPLEADLITGRVTEAGFLVAAGRLTPRPATAKGQRTDGKRKPNPVVVKVLGYRRFFDELPGISPPLSAGAVAVWCWLWTCERKGLARCTVRSLARRFGVGPSTAGRWLAELRGTGFAQVVRRGCQGKAATVIRVRTSPKRVADAEDRPASGTR